MGHNCVRRFTLANYSWITWTQVLFWLVWKLYYCFWLTLTNTLQYEAIPEGSFIPTGNKLHFHFLLWRSQTGSVLFVKAKANKRPLLCLYFKLLWQHPFNRAHTHVHTHLPYLFHLDQLPARVFIIPQVLFIAHKDDGNVWGRNVLPLASISLEYSLEEAKKSEWNLTSLLIYLEMI